MTVSEKLSKSFLVNIYLQNVADKAIFLAFHVYSKSFFHSQVYQGSLLKFERDCGLN